jgi:hypothetical protein
MTDEELNEKMKPMLNRSVVVIAKDHPHFKEVGETVRCEFFMGKPAIVVKGEWEEFGVFNGKDLKFLD